MASEKNSKPVAPSRSLTDIPADIIAAHILPRLPFADAVRTSVLCRSWRNLWRSIPDLDLDFSDDELTIFTFDAAGDIRSFTVVSLPGYNFTVSSAIFSFKNLTQLNLYSCNLTHLEESLGFPNLEVLDLKLCDFLEDSSAVSDLISGCPLLKDLRLVDVMGCRYLEISAPNLQSLVVHCFFEHFTFSEFPPRLAVVSIGLSSIEDDEEDDDLYEEEFDDEEEFDEGNCNLLALLGKATRIEKLELVRYSLYHVGRFGVPERMPNRFLRLRVVKMAVDFAVWKETAAALCLLRSCPNLEELEIEGHDYRRRYDYSLGEGFWEGEGRFNLARLRVLKLTTFTCSETDLDFLKFLLPCAVWLAELTIDPNELGGIDKLKFAEELRALTKAEVQFGDIKIGSDHSDHDTSAMSENVEPDADKDTGNGTDKDNDMDTDDDANEDTKRDTGNGTDTDNDMDTDDDTNEDTDEDTSEE